MPWCVPWGWEVAGTVGPRGSERTSQQPFHEILPAAQGWQWGRAAAVRMHKTLPLLFSNAISCFIASAGCIVGWSSSLTRGGGLGLEFRVQGSEKCLAREQADERWHRLTPPLRRLPPPLAPSPPRSTPPLPLVRSALTAPSALEGCDYERLETLGDAFLKYLVG